MVRRKKIRILIYPEMIEQIGEIINMIYILIALISIGLWFVFVGIAKLIDLSNRNKEWYKKIQESLEENTV